MKLSLGDAWTTSREEAKHQPHLCPTGLDLTQTYIPCFYDGWTPNLTALGSPTDSHHSTGNDLSRLAFSTAAQVQQQYSNGHHPHNHHHGHHTQQKQLSGAVATSSHHGATNNVNTTSSSNGGSGAKTVNGTAAGVGNNKTGKTMMAATATTTTAMAASSYNESNGTQSKSHANVRAGGVEDMKKWAVDLVYRGVKVYEVFYCFISLTKKFL